MLKAKIETLKARQRISVTHKITYVPDGFSYTLYTSRMCKGFSFNGSFKTKSECKRAIKRMGVKLGQTIEVIQ